ncbi:SMP-30/gluconolactonase/LRE family protein [Streptomyces sp. NPDC006711]|uniref:SMP-30/gluconolactonase/LRE family protein n=1 Tax=Streptomyces sp. NPDC006711 TaxID=3364762 RepID=UPI0036C6E099
MRRGGAATRPDPAPLPSPRRVALGATGPEDVVFDREGRVLTGVDDGRVLRIVLPGARRPATIEQVGHTHGRPLGLELLPDGRLLVCDAHRGLLRLDPEGNRSAEVLADSVAGSPLRFCSNAVAATDGTIYFTVSSRRHGLDDWLSDILEHEPTGLLVRLSPGGEPQVLLDGLQFANGVALAPDESYVMVAETGACRLTRLRLSGPGAGRKDTLADALPGLPDNVSSSPGGGFWVALAAPRTPPARWLHRAPARARRAVAAAARHLPDPPPSGAWVIEVDAEGRVLRELRGGRRRFGMTTSVAEREERLVMGSLVENAIAWCELPAAR